MRPTLVQNSEDLWLVIPRFVTASGLLVGRWLRLIAWVVAYFMCGVGPVVAAGNWNVSPMTVTLAASQRSVALTVNNNNVEPVVIQLQVVAWSQQNDLDEYTPTQDLIVVPPVFTVPASGKQVVRIGLRHLPRGVREQAYRLFLAEAPAPPKSSTSVGRRSAVGLQVLIRIGVPVFVVSSDMQPVALEWQLFRSSKDRLNIKLANNGGTHIKISNIATFTTGGSKLKGQQINGYILAGQSHQWQTDIQCPKAENKLNLVIKTDDGKEIATGMLPVADIP